MVVLQSFLVIFDRFLVVFRGISGVFQSRFQKVFSRKKIFTPHMGGGIGFEYPPFGWKKGRLDKTLYTIYNYYYYYYFTSIREQRAVKTFLFAIAVTNLVAKKHQILEIMMLFVNMFTKVNNPASRLPQIRPFYSPWGIAKI